MALVLRDVHLPDSPSFWPPAPGWWWLAGVIAVVSFAAAFFQRRGLRRRRAINALFDDALAAATTPAERIGASSELLRRAARTRAADADHLEGDAWLQFLNSPGLSFSEGDGRLLADGAYRRDVDAQQSDAVVKLARARFLSLMAARR